MTFHHGRAARSRPQPSLGRRAQRTRLIRRRRRGRALVGSSLMTVSVVGVLLAPTVAGAQSGGETTLAATKEAWAWRNNDPTEPIETPIPAPIPDVELPAPNVEGGTLPVGVSRGQAEYKSFLQFQDLAAGGIPSDATIDKLTITLHEAGVKAGPVRGVEACAVAEFWPQDTNVDWPEAPKDQCAFSVSGQADGTTWTFELASLGRAWLAGDLANNGIALNPILPNNLPVGQPEPEAWQISFAGRSRGEQAPVIDIEYTVPEPEPSPSPSSLPSSTPTFGPSPTANASPTTGGPSASPTPTASASASPSPAPAAFTPPPPPPPAFNPPPSQPGASFGAPVFGQPPVFQPPAPAAGSGQPPAPVVAGPGAPPPVAPGPVVAVDPAVGAAGAPGKDTPYAWFLAPIGLFGLYLLARSLTEDAELVVVREGAVSRLIKRRELERAHGAIADPLFQV